MRLDTLSMFFDAKAMSGTAVTSSTMDIGAAGFAEAEAYVVANFDDLRGDFQLFGQTIPATEVLAVPAQKAQGHGDLVGGKGRGAMLTSVHRDLPVFSSVYGKDGEKTRVCCAFAEQKWTVPHCLRPVLTAHPSLCQI